MSDLHRRAQQRAELPVPEGVIGAFHRLSVVGDLLVKLSISQRFQQFPVRATAGDLVLGESRGVAVIGADPTLVLDGDSFLVADPAGVVRGELLAPGHESKDTVSYG